MEEAAPSNGDPGDTVVAVGDGDGDGKATAVEEEEEQEQEEEEDVEVGVVALSTGDVSADDATRPKSSDRSGTLFAGFTDVDRAAMPRRMATTFRRQDSSIGSLPTSRGSFSTFAALAYTVNYVIGIGVVGIPLGFYRAGWALGLIVLLCITSVSYMTMIWILEVMCRTEALVQLEEMEVQAAITADDSTAVSPPPPSMSTMSTVLQPLAASAPPSRRDRLRRWWISLFTPTACTHVTERSVREGLQKSLPDLKRRLRITNRKFEVNELVNISLGLLPKLIYDVFLFCYLFGLLWGFTSIFGTSMTEIIPMAGLSANSWPCSFYPASDLTSECFTAYQIYVLIFAAIVLPLSMLDLTQQKPVQLGLFAYRYVALTIMVLWCAAYLGIEPYNPANPITSPPFVGLDVSAFDSSGFSIILSTCCFAQLTHHSIPGLVQPMRSKQHLTKVFFWALVSTFFVYAAVGCVLSVYFGVDTADLVTLNWSTSSSTGSYAWWEYLINYIIVLLPLFLAISSFPLRAVTLGNNILAALPAQWTKNQSSRRWRLGCRLAIAVPPLVLGAFEYQLAVVIQFTGLTGVFIAFIFPALMQYASRRKITTLARGDMPTPYTNAFSTLPFVIFALLFGFTVLGLMIAGRVGAL